MVKSLCICVVRTRVLSILSRFAVSSRVPLRLARLAPTCAVPSSVLRVHRTPRQLTRQLSTRSLCMRGDGVDFLSALHSLTPLDWTCWDWLRLVRTAETTMDGTAPAPPSLANDLRTLFDLISRLSYFLAHTAVHFVSPRTAHSEPHADPDRTRRPLEQSPSSPSPSPHPPSPSSTTQPHSPST